MKRVLVTIWTAVSVLAALAALVVAPSAGGQPSQPRIDVYLSGGIFLEGFEGSASVTIEIRDEPGGTLLLSQVGTTEPGGGFGTSVEGVLDLLGGMEVRADDGTNSQSLVLADNLAITVFDLENDTLRGTGPTTAATVSVYAEGPESGSACTLMPPVVGGVWEANFGVGPCLKDLQADTYIELALGDERGATVVQWQRPECDGQPATIWGTPDADVIVGTGQADVIHGLGGNDTISGKGGGDTICGGKGRDSLRGGGGKDTIFGQGGADTIEGGKGADTIEGNAGPDTIDGNGGPDNIKGGGGADTISGGGKGDTIAGGPKGDVLNGNGGPDVIEGNGGKDKIRGGPGNDTCDGGAGANDIKGC